METPSTHLSDPVSEVLAEIAIRLQLGPTDYKAAAVRYEAIGDHIEQGDSPLADRVVLFYPQGSLAIHAAIVSGTTDDRFDLDVVAELDIPPEIGAAAVLDQIYKAIKGAPGSRYYGRVVRHSRCVTVQWDNMHLDVTPARRRPLTPKRVSDIFHHEEGSPSNTGYSRIANPFGFAKWLNGQVEEDLAFAEDYAARDHAYRQAFLAEAERLPLPHQEPPRWKSPRLIVLQLLKRWRNLRYATRRGRPVPSVVLSTLTVQAAGSATSLFGELRLVANRLVDKFERADRARKKIEVVNPACADDVFTDRWPENLEAQRVFLNDLQHLVLTLGRIGEDVDLHELSRAFGGLFGEGPTRPAIGSYAKRVATAFKGGTVRSDRKTGRITTAAAGGVGTASISGAARRHTFYGAG